VLDSGGADATQVAALAEKIKAAAASSAPSGEPAALVVAAHAAPRRATRIGLPRAATGTTCTATITFSRSADALLISSDTPIRCPPTTQPTSAERQNGPAAMTATTTTIAAAPAGPIRAVVDLYSADTNPTMQKACEFVDVVLPFVESVPGIGLGGKLFDIGVCHNGIRVIYKTLQAARFIPR
jgi:hypothetical protein